MKLTFNKYWILISICIIMNILVFIFLSNRLENYVFDNIITNQNISDGV